MNKMILDLTGCKSLLELHLIIKDTFGFPDFYGNNLSALWDSMWEYCPPNTIVYIKGVGTLPKNFDEYMSKVFRVLRRAEAEEENIRFEIVS